MRLYCARLLFCNQHIPWISFKSKVRLTCSGYILFKEPSLY